MDAKRIGSRQIMMMMDILRFDDGRTNTGNGNFGTLPVLL